MSRRSRTHAERDALARLAAGVKRLWERGGESFGDAYAVAATAFLERRERIEDLNAERKFQQHGRSRSAQ